MRTTIAATLLAIAFSGCTTIQSPSQAAHRYTATQPPEQVRACVAEVFTPRFYGGVEAQGGWPSKPVDMTIEPDGNGTVITTRGPMDPRFGRCLGQ